MRAGAFDSHRPTTARSLLASVGIAHRGGGAGRAQRAAGSPVRRRATASPTSRIALVAAPRWDERQKLAEEKLALGFYLSGHPFAAYRRELAGLLRVTLADVQPRSEPVLLGGMIVSCRTAMTRRGKMGIILLDDGTAQLEVTVYSELFDLNRDLLKEDRPLLIQGKVALDQFSGNNRVSAERLFDLASARARYARELRLSMNGEASKAAAAAAREAEGAARAVPQRFVSGGDHLQQRPVALRGPPRRGVEGLAGRRAGRAAERVAAPGERRVQLRLSGALTRSAAPRSPRTFRPREPRRRR